MPLSTCRTSFLPFIVNLCICWKANHACRCLRQVWDLTTKSAVALEVSFISLSHTILQHWADITNCYACFLMNTRYLGGNPITTFLKEIPTAYNGTYLTLLGFCHDRYHQPYTVRLEVLFHDFICSPDHVDPFILSVTLEVMFLQCGGKEFTFTP